MVDPQRKRENEFLLGGVLFGMLCVWWWQAALAVYLCSCLVILSVSFWMFWKERKTHG